MNLKAQLKNHKLITVSMLILLMIISSSLVFANPPSGIYYNTQNITLSTALSSTMKGITTNGSDFWFSHVDFSNSYRPKIYHYNSSFDLIDSYHACESFTPPYHGVIEIAYDKYDNTLVIPCFSVNIEILNMDGTFNRTLNTARDNSELIAVAGEDYYAVWEWSGSSATGGIHLVNKTSGGYTSIVSYNNYDTVCGGGRDIVGGLEATDDYIYILGTVNGSNGICVTNYSGNYVGSLFSELSAIQFGLESSVEPANSFYLPKDSDELYYMEKAFKIEAVSYNDNATTNDFHLNNALDEFLVNISTTASGQSPSVTFHLIDADGIVRVDNATMTNTSLTEYNYSSDILFNTTGLWNYTAWINTTDGEETNTGSFRIFPVVPTTLTPTSGTYNNTITINCSGSEIDGKTIYYDIYGYYNETGESKSWHSITTDDTDGVYNWTFFTNYSEMILSQDEVDFRCSASDTDSVSSIDYFNPAGNVTLNSSGNPSLTLDYMVDETKDSTPYVELSSNETGDIKYKIGGGEYISLCNGCDSYNGALSDLINWGLNEITFQTCIGDGCAVVLHNITLNKPSLSVQGGDDWKDFLNNTFELVDYNDSIIKKSDIIIRSGTGNPSQIVNNIRYDYVPALILGEGILIEAQTYFLEPGAIDNGIGNQIKIINNYFLSDYSIEDIINVTNNTNTMYYLGDATYGTCGRGIGLATAEDYATDVTNYSLIFFNRTQPMANMNCGNNEDYNDHAEYIVFGMINITDYTLDGEYIINQSILRLQDSSPLIMNMTPSTGDGQGDDIFEPDDNIILYLDLTSWNNYKLNETTTVSANITRADGTSFILNLYDGGLINDTYSEDNIYTGNFTMRNLTTEISGQWNITYTINDTTEEYGVNTTTDEIYVSGAKSIYSDTMEQASIYPRLGEYVWWRQNITINTTGRTGTDYIYLPNICPDLANCWNSGNQITDPSVYNTSDESESGNLTLAFTINSAQNETEIYKKWQLRNRPVLANIQNHGAGHNNTHYIQRLGYWVQSMNNGGTGGVCSSYAEGEQAHNISNLNVTVYIRPNNLTIKHVLWTDGWEQNCEMGHNLSCFLCGNDSSNIVGYTVTNNETAGYTKLEIQLSEIEGDKFTECFAGSADISGTILIYPETSAITGYIVTEVEDLLESNYSNLWDYRPYWQISYFNTVFMSWEEPYHDEYWQVYGAEQSDGWHYFSGWTSGGVLNGQHDEVQFKISDETWTQKNEMHQIPNIIRGAINGDEVYYWQNDEFTYAKRNTVNMSLFDTERNLSATGVKTDCVEVIHRRYFYGGTINYTYHEYKFNNICDSEQNITWSESFELWQDGDSGTQRVFNIPSLINNNINISEIKINISDWNESFISSYRNDSHYIGGLFTFKDKPHTLWITYDDVGNFTDTYMNSLIDGATLNKSYSTITGKWNLTIPANTMQSIKFAHGLAQGSNETDIQEKLLTLSSTALADDSINDDPLITWWHWDNTTATSEENGTNITTFEAMDNLNVQFNFTGYDPNSGDTVIYFVDLNGVTQCSDSNCSVSFTGLSGEQTVSLIISDSAVNVSQDFTVNVTASNQAPNVTLNYPADGATGIELNPVLNITVLDADNDTMNISFYQKILVSFSLNDELLNASDDIYSVFVDSDYIYTGGKDNKTQIYNKTNFNLVTELINASATIFSIFTDGTYIYVGGEDTKVQIYNKTNFNLVTELINASDRIMSIFVDSDYIYTGGEDNKTQVYNKSGFSLITELLNASDKVYSVFADDDYIYAGGFDYKVQIYNKTNFNLVTELINASREINYIFVDSDYVYTCGKDNKTQIYNKTSFGLVTELLNSSDEIYSVYTDSDYIYTGGKDYKVQIYNKTNFNLVTELINASDSVYSIFVDNDYIYAGGFDYKVQIYNKTSYFSFQLLNLTVGSMNGSEVIYTWSGLEESTMHYWSVNVTDGVETFSNCDNAWNFTTGDFTNPEAHLSIDDQYVEYGVENVTIIWVLNDTLAIDSAGVNITYPNGSILFESNDAENNTTLQPVNLSVLGEYIVYIWANDTSGNTNSTSDSFLVNDTVAPVCTMISHTPSDIEANSTGLLEVIINCTDSSGINISSMVASNTVEGFIIEGYPNLWSTRPPANDKTINDTYISESILRAKNRGLGRWFDNLFEDNYSHSAYDITYNEVTITNGSTWALFNYTGVVEPTIFRNSVYLQQTNMECENKKNYAVVKDNSILMKVVNIEHMLNTSDYIMCSFKNINVTSSTPKLLKEYYCSSDFNISDSIIPSASSDCVLLTNLADSDVIIDYSVRNSSYVKHCYSFVNQSIISIPATDYFYLYYESDVTGGVEYHVRYVNESTNTNISFFDSGVAWQTSDEGVTFVQSNFTPDVWVSTIKNGDETQIGIHTTDNSVNQNSYLNLTLYTDEIGDVNYPISNPLIEYYYSPSGMDENLNGTHLDDLIIHIHLAVDPDDVGTVNHSLVLINNSNTSQIIYTINDTFYSDEGDLNITFNTLLVSDGIYKMKVIAIADDNPNDVQSFLTLNNFTIDNSPPTVSQYYQWDVTNTTVNISMWTDGYLSINWNITDVSGINQSECLIKVRNKDTTTDNTILSFINESVHPDYDSITGYKDMTCYFEDMGNDITRVYANFSNNYYWRPVIMALDNLNASHDTSTLLFGGKASKMIFNNITNVINMTFIFYADVVNQTLTVADLHFYSCNSSYTTGDFTTSPYCGLVGTASPESTRDSNFGYLMGALATDENGSFGGVIHTETMYGISHCPDCTNTNNAWIAYSTNGYEGHSETAVQVDGAWSALSGSDFNVILHTINDVQLEFNLTINDSMGNKLSDLQIDGYTPPVNQAPFGFLQTDNATGGLISYYDIHNVTEAGLIWINTTVLDPEEDSVNCSLYLLNNDSSLNQTLVALYQLNGYGTFPYEWNTSSVDDGDYRFNVTCTDGLLTGFDESDGYIRTDNTAPTLDQPLANIEVQTNESVSFDINASDSSTISYYVSDTSNFTIGVSDGLLENNTQLSKGIYELTITINDSVSNSLIDYMNVTVTDTSPVFDQALPDVSIFHNVDLGLQVNCSDIDSEDAFLYYDNTTLFDINASGYISDNPGQGEVGNHSILITCESGGVNITDDFTYEIKNSAPSIDSYDPLSNPNITEPNNQSFTINTSDSESDAMTYSWKQNGTEVATTQNFTFVGNYTSAGSYNISVIVSDSLDTSNHEWVLTVSDADVTNPDVTLTKDSATVEFGLENNTINWTASDNVNIDSAEFNLTYPNGSLIFTSGNESGSILLQPANLTTIGTYSISLWANDTSGNPNSTSDSFLVNDTSAPTLDQPLQNITRRSDQPLSFDVNASDPSGIDSYSVSDNIYFEIDSSGLLENKTFTPKGTYNLTITINDTLGHTLTGDLTLMIVNTTNSLPVLSEVNVSSIDGGVHDSMYCDGGTYSDIDSDPEVGRYYQWYINESYIKNSTEYSTSLYANLTKGDNVSCEVLTTDGYNSTARNSSNQITIINTAPINTLAPTVSNTTPALNEIISCINGTWDDYDAGDSINESQVMWYKDSVNVGNQTDYNVTDYGTYTCSQRVADGEDWSDWETSSDSAIIHPPFDPYTASDIPNIISDNVGEAGVGAKVWAGFLIAVSVIVGGLLML